MMSTRASSRITLVLAGSLLISVPLMLGQGCPGTALEPVTGRPPSGSTAPITTGNMPPFFEFTEPAADISREVGDTITISWNADDPDSNAAITLILDPDAQYGNGNERVIVPVILEDSRVETYQLNTTAMSPPLEPGTYRIVARVNDGVNPELLVTAPGRLLLFGRGLLPGNVSPSIVVSQPTLNLGVSQNDLVQISYCARDPDNGNGNVVPDILLLLDLDDNPSNDVDLTGPNAEANLNEICLGGGFPRAVPGAIVLGCFKKNADCTQPNAAPNPADPTTPTTFTLTVDVGQVPPRASGDPYRVRGMIWDHTNRPVNGYAPGSISVTALGSGTIDLAAVGRSISGSRFLGFDAGARAGYNGMTLGDFDQDGVDDFLIVSRFGRPFERGNIGSAYMIYGVRGDSGTKFGSEVHLSSVGLYYRGCQFAMGAGSGAMRLGVTNGIETVSTIPDITGDGRPEIFFGMTYVEQLYDYHDDDPCDNGSCALDLMPNPLSTNTPGNDDMGNYDLVEGGTCSNDLDLNRFTPIDQGYVIMVSSENPLENTVLELALTAMKDGISNDEGTVLGPANAPNGARFRGGWYDEFDYTQTRFPYSIIPDNEFGKTINSMPDMGNGSSPAARDGVPELLISAPNSYRGKGSVSLTFGQDFSTFHSIAGSDGIASIPIYRRVGECVRAPLWPTFRTIQGSAIGDQLGYAGAAGDFNLDGNQDVLCGAPGADRNGVTDGGIVYIIFGRIDFGNVDLAQVNPPRLELRGTTRGDGFGGMQTLIGDLNQDGVPDIGFASQFADGPGGVDSGFIGVVFGGRRLTGENVFTVGQVGGAQLPGVKFYGTQVNGRAGASIANAGDFNGDGIDDLLITAPNETRTVGGQVRRGVAYLIFGGIHLSNAAFNLNQVGTPQLPGAIFVSPYAQGTAEEAPIDFAAAAGDVNGDGFNDLLVGVSFADYINPLEPGQRRNDAGECYLIYGSNTGSNVVR